MICCHYVCPLVWHKSLTFSISHLRQATNSYKYIFTEFQQAVVVSPLQKFYIFLINSQTKKILYLQHVSVHLFTISVKIHCRKICKNQIAAIQTHLGDENCFSITLFFFPLTLDNTGGLRFNQRWAPFTRLLI